MNWVFGEPVPMAVVGEVWLNVVRYPMAYSDVLIRLLAPNAKFDLDIAFPQADLKVGEPTLHDQWHAQKVRRP